MTLKELAVNPKTPSWMIRAAAELLSKEPIAAMNEVELLRDAMKNHWEERMGLLRQ